MAVEVVEELSGLDDVSFARDLAARTGELLLRVREEVGYADFWTLQDEGDRAAQVFIDRQLRAHRPDDAILSEEAPDDWVSRESADRVWIIDPVDGTSAFARRGSTEWAVHVALWEAGELVLGVVARPATGEIFDSQTVQLAPVQHPGRVRVAASRSRASDIVRAVCHDVHAEVVTMSSAGVKALAVVTGEVDAYLHTGGQSQWDNAAPVAVALGAGLVATRFDGSPIVYNGPEVEIDDLIICRPERIDEFRSAIDSRL
ncbi:3'(2'),5'-bisphosphate nucleotidase CysQ [Epidermidibacterium keratini]|uniref:3'(2'),5-bisphosphonucleoside 3'(2')-phosphohydrolase n=1 Tax=Epidermidibacterium keratini TaxID=1891644 RepID=A0A7L4YQH0_9ACTN|nr:3'(2'),5'-bisphosphate nucleotidase CysQ [Epidermidibacterium keratini]QHC01272.1 3'(2'),5'-bisphosphate nucleotidase CysQ [Epidermidibacterium keratini]